MTVPSTAVLVVNGFDMFSNYKFNVDEARDYPWIRICLEQLRACTDPESYRVLVWNNSPLEEHRKILEAAPEVTICNVDDSRDVRHGHALDLLMRQVTDDFEYVVTLDTDAFPVRRGWLDNLIGRLVDGAAIAGVWRDEMAEVIRPYVHPSCLITRRRTIVDLGLSFRKKGGPDVGHNVSMALLERGLQASRLRRSNVRNPHFLMAGLYGDLVYHQGAGSRRADFWTSDEYEHDEAARIAIRNAVFDDLTGFVAYLSGNIDDAEARGRKLDAIVDLVGQAP